MEVFAQQSALIVVDMQPYFETVHGYEDNGHNKEKAKKVIHRITKLIEMAQSSSIPIVMVSYSGGGPIASQLQKAVGAYNKVFFYEKTHPDMFFRGNEKVAELSLFLKSYGVTDLVFSGANGGACVYCSIDSSLRKKYQVWVDTHGVIDYNTAIFRYPYVYSEKVVEFLVTENSTEELILKRADAMANNKPPMQQIINPEEVIFRLQQRRVRYCRKIFAK